MKKNKNIIESVDLISEEYLLIQELDKRLSFDLVAALGDVPITITPTCGIRG